MWVLDDEAKKSIDKDTQKVAMEFGHESSELEITSDLQAVIYEKTYKFEQIMDATIDKYDVEREKILAQIDDLKESVAIKDKMISGKESTIEEMRMKEANTLLNKIKTMYNQEFEEVENTLKSCKEFAVVINESVKQFGEKRHELGVFVAANKSKLAMVEADLKFEKTNKAREVNEIQQDLQTDKIDLEDLITDINEYYSIKESAQIRAVTRELKLNKFRPPKIPKN